MSSNPFVPFSDIRYQLVNPLNLHPDLRDLIANGLIVVIDLGTMGIPALKAAWASAHKLMASRVMTGASATMGASASETVSMMEGVTKGLTVSQVDGLVNTLTKSTARSVTIAPYGEGTWQIINVTLNTGETIGVTSSLVKSFATSVGTIQQKGLAFTKAVSAQVTKMYTYVAATARSMPKTVFFEGGQVAAKTLTQSLTGTGAIGVAGSSSRNIPLIWTPLVFGSSFFLTGVMAETFNDLKDWASGTDADGVAIAKAFTSRVDALVRNKSALTSMGYEEIKVMWEDYQQACAILGIEPVPFPEGYFKEKEGELTEKQYLQMQHDLDMIELKYQDQSYKDNMAIQQQNYLAGLAAQDYYYKENQALANQNYIVNQAQANEYYRENQAQANQYYQENQAQANEFYRQNLAYQDELYKVNQFQANEFYKENMATQQAYNMAEIDARYKNEVALLKERLYREFGNDTFLANQKLQAELTVLRERLAREYGYDVALLNQRYAVERQAGIIESRDAWDLLGAETQEVFLRSGITRQRYLDYNRVQGTVSQVVLDKLFPEFMDTAEAIDNSLKYGDVMEWILGMDDTEEPPEYDEIYEGDKEFATKSMTVAEFYGLVSGDRYRPRKGKRRFA